MQEAGTAPKRQLRSAHQSCKDDEQRRCAPFLRAVSTRIRESTRTRSPGKSVGNILLPATRKSLRRPKRVRKNRLRPAMSPPCTMRYRVFSSPRRSRGSGSRVSRSSAVCDSLTFKADTRDVHGVLSNLKAQTMYRSKVPKRSFTWPRGAPYQEKAHDGIIPLAACHAAG
jgi:hypothetical protein